MSIHDSPFKHDEYRLVLVRLNSHGTWAEFRGVEVRLPRIAIRSSARAAEQAQRVIEDTWRSSAFILDFLPGDENQAPCAIAEIPSYQFPHGLISIRIDELPETEITAQERAVIEEILAGNPGSRGPFSRAGWIEEAKAWLCAEVGHKVDLSGEIWQYNATSSFALVRFGTRSGPAYWLKGTGEPNLHELQVTRILAETCPEFLPTQIAAREDWNAWLMEDAGQPVKAWSLPTLERAALSMVSLQKKFVGRASELLAVGAADQRISTLREHVFEVVEYFHEAMAQQVSSRVPRVEPRRLWQIASILQNACDCMEDLGVPDTLIHNDLNTGNILFSERGCVFTDWCESCVGNPFCAFQQLCLLQPSGTGDWISKLRMVYRNCWLDLLHSSQIDAAFALSPLLAIFSHLFGRGTWLRSPRRNDPQVKAYARSLARHMDRAAQNSSLLEAI